LRAFDLDLSVSQIIVGASLGQVAGSLPLPSVGSIGTHETGWTTGFVWVGVPLSDAALTGIGTQVVTLAFAALFGLPAWLLQRRPAQGATPD